MADGKVEIDTSINTSNAEKGINTLGKKLKSLADGSTIKNIAKVTGAFAGITAAVKATTKAIQDTSEAFRGDLQVQKQLEIAVKNNPYLNGESVESLEAFADQLSKISSYSGGELIGVMAQLASTGRTQTEIQNIMTAALDLSASGMMSLDSAVQTLNGTLAGQAGALARQISELKDLSEEELKAGKGIEIIKNKYAGMSEEVTKATGHIQQMKIAQDDFKSAIGEFTNPISDSWADFWKGFFEKGTETIKKLKEELNNNDTVTDKGSATTILNALASRSYDAAHATKGLSSFTWEKALSAYSDKDLIQTRDLLEDESSSFKDSFMGGNKKTAYEKITEEANKREEAAKAAAKAEAEAAAQAEKAAQAAKEEADAKAKATEAAKKAAENDKNAQEIINNNQTSLDRQIAQIRKEAELKGEAADEQEILNAMMNSYIDLVTTDTRYVTEENSVAQTRLDQIKKQQELVNDLNKSASFTNNGFNLLDQKEQMVEIQDTIKGLIQTEAEAKQAEIDLLDSQFDQLSAEAKYQVWDDYTKAREKLLNELKSIEEQDTSPSILEKGLNYLKTYSDKYKEMLDQIASYENSNAETTANYKTALLEKQYSEGLVSEEEYYKQKEAIEKEQAQKEYRMQMWQWTAQVAQVTANTAQGISEALKKGTDGIAEAAILASMGAIQLATVIGSKPIAPAYANGGIVGASLGADNTLATVRTGEMVLNALQQKQLWQVANGRSNASGAGANIQIKNYRGNDTTVTPEITKDGITLLIQKTVNEQLSSGKYNKSLKQAQSSFSGISYIN